MSVLTVTIMGLLPSARAYLEAKGCSIVEYDTQVSITFPPGTEPGEELAPRVHYARYLYTLPDGSSVEVHRGAEQSHLYLPADSM